MTTIENTETIEFGLAESIWSKAEDKESKLRAIDFYKLACEKNDARAFFALYKINSTYATSYLITGKQHNSSNYLDEAIRRGCLPAFLYVGEDDSRNLIYDRLVFLATGLAFANKSKDPMLTVFQEAFISLSTNFAKEFIPEIIQRGECWKFGDLVDISESKIQGLIKHPNKFIPEKDRVRPNWYLFSGIKKIDQYLQNLPGYHDYKLATDADDMGDYQLYKLHIEKACAKGNGQAIYALKQNLINAAENGSPDSFVDLIDYFLQIKTCSDFKNTSTLESSKNFDFLMIIDCVVYLYTLMERLGIENYPTEYGVEAENLTYDTESGYGVEIYDIKELKYQLCDHEHIVKINDRAYLWHLGQKFDSEFIAKLGVIKKF